MEDIAYNSDFQTSYDSVGDIQTVTDKNDDHAAVRQAITTSIIERVDFTAPAITPKQISKQRSAIEGAVRNNRFSEPPIAVSIEGIDETVPAVAYRVQTNRVSFTLTDN